MYPPPLDPDLVPAMIENLRNPSRSYDARLFLLQVGPAAVQPLCAAFHDARDGTEFKYLVADVLEWLSQDHDVPDARSVALKPIRMRTHRIADNAIMGGECH